MTTAAVPSLSTRHSGGGGDGLGRLGAPLLGPAASGHYSPPHASSSSLGSSPERNSPSAYSPDDSSAAPSQIAVQTHVRRQHQQRQHGGWRWWLHKHRPTPALALALVALMALLLWGVSAVLPSHAAPLAAGGGIGLAANGGSASLRPHGRRAGPARAAGAAHRQVQPQLVEDDDSRDDKSLLFEEQTLFGQPRRVRPPGRVDTVQQLTGVTPLFGQPDGA